MVDVVHKLGTVGWEFVGRTEPPLIGGGRDLERSKCAAEHAVRHYLSQQSGTAVDLDDARRETRHLHPGHSVEGRFTRHRD